MSKIEAGAEEQNEPAAPVQGQSTSSFWSWLKVVVIAVVIVGFLHVFVFAQSIVDGHSMQPTLHNGDHLFLDKAIYHFAEPARHDVVVLHDPEPLNRDLLVKRIIGVAGDTIEISGGSLYVNGVKQDESYVDSSIEDGNYGPYTVPAGDYFVMGDNRHAQASKDSRYFGAVPRSAIIGRAEFVLWPLSHWRGL